jgi:hypothetical protein
MEDDDEGTKDWAARECAKDQREAQMAKEAKEKSERDKRLKDERGIEHFRELHAWMKGQAESDRGQTLEETFSVGKIEPFGGPAPYDFFKVSSTKSERLTMEISYRTPPSAPHGITVECGVVPKPQYSLSVGDDGNVFFETPKRQPKTIEELGSEMLDLWRKSRI